MPSSVHKEQHALFLNLLALGFEVQAEEQKHGCRFDEYMFDKPNNRAFSVVCHFLFKKLNAKQAQELFRTCFPMSNKQSTQEFRKVCYNWLRRIADESKLPTFPKVNSTVFMSPGGREFIHLMFHFSNYVLFTLAGKVSEGGIPQPTMLSSDKRLHKIQRQGIEVFLHHSFIKLHSQMINIRKNDNQIQHFSEKQVKLYHLLQQQKKKLLQTRSHIMDKHRIKSERKFVEHKKCCKQEAVKSMETARSMWNQLSATVESTSYLREVLNSVLCGERDHYAVDSNELQVKVPAKLLDECQEEIYQSVGTSLYQGGKINLASLASLADLSLALITDKIHEDGVPNFESNTNFLSLQHKLHRSELESLADIRKTLEITKQDLEQQTADHIYKLKEIYDQRKMLTIENETDSVSLHDSLDDESDTESTGENSICSPQHALGLAEIYLMPADNKDLLFLDELISPDHKKDLVRGKPCIDLDTSTASQAWNISVQDILHKSPTVKSPKPSLTKSTLVQGTHKRTNFKQTLHVRKPVKAQHLTPEIHRKSHFQSKVRGRKSISLPSSPFPPSTTGTPYKEEHAETKLIEQIVNCTVNENVSENPVVVYHQDSTSQLDRTAFISLDKLQRTPPLANLSTDRSSTDILQDRLQQVRDQTSFAPIDTSLKYEQVLSDDSLSSTSTPNNSSQRSSPSSSGGLECENNIQYRGTATPVFSSQSSSSDSPVNISPDLDNFESFLSGVDLRSLSKSGLGCELLDLSDAENSPPSTPPAATGKLVSVSDELVSLEEITKPVCSQQSSARNNPIDLLMETPPPIAESTSGKRLRCSKRVVSPLVDLGPTSEAYTNLLQMTPTVERPTLQEVSLNPRSSSELLIDLQTPNLQRTRPMKQ